jgi:hypothetical protein
MTKPSNFIANSDYLSLAQKSNTDFTVVFPAENFPPGAREIRTHDITVPSIKGAIDEVMISRNGSDYYLGNSLTVSANSPSLTFYIYRPSPNTLRVRLLTSNSSQSGYSMPMQTLKIRVSSFLPPNVF